MEDRPLVERSIFQLLRPSPALRSAMERAIANATANYSDRRRVMALHPRIEQEMMTHRCHVFHEQNLTRVFQRIGSHPAFRDNNNNTHTIDHDDTTNSFNYDLIFLAVSAYQVEKPPRSDPQASHLIHVMIQNKDTLLHARQYGVFGVPIFESGASTATQVMFTKNNLHNNNNVQFNAESHGVIELTASIINFFTAVKADVFIGVRGSSFSTDVFAVRHYLNEDIMAGGTTSLNGGNYIIGPDGIEELIGPPRVHSC